MRAAIEIKKSGGGRETFDAAKLEQSLQLAGADDALVSKISSHILEEAIGGMTTDQIYDHAYFLLKKYKSPAIARYSLKRAVSQMGPTGFPFEHYIAELFKARGFSATTNVIVEGGCARHEIDVVAWNSDELVMMEAKFHGDFGLKSDLKVALYVRGRAEDISKKSYSFGGITRKVNQFLLVTNTNFSLSAISYSACVGLGLLGWTYPAKGNLHDLIDDSGLHPLSCLTTLGASHQRMLFERGIVLCKSIKNNSGILHSLGLSQHETDGILAEANLVCEPRAKL